MSTQQLDTLLGEAAKVADQLGDPALLDECKRMVLPAKIYRAANYEKHDPIGSIRNAWNDYARTLRRSLAELGTVFTATIADIRNVRTAIIDLLREIDVGESARLESATMDFKRAAGPAKGGLVGDMQRQTSQISEQLQKFSHVAQVVPLWGRVIDIDHDIEVLTQQFGNPRLRLLVALIAIRGIRALNLGLRSALSAAIYVGVFGISYSLDDRVKEFFAGLLAGQASSYAKLFGVMLLIELAKGKLVELLVEKPLRRWEAYATGREMESLSGLSVRTYILIAKMKAALRDRNATATPPPSRA
jgi:hypothetical protein